MRPSVASPTGTVIGAPVSITSVPRARPSVVSIATARTRSSPRCCCTSHTSTAPPAPELMPGASSSAPAAGRATVIAWLISGSRSGKTASMTTPWISSMRPTLRFVPAFAGASVWGAVLASISCLDSPVVYLKSGWDGRWHGVRRRRCGDQLTPSAPATTSMISCVISAWRARFISSVRSVMISPAFSEALRIAVMRAPCSDAVDSSSAR